MRHQRIEKLAGRTVSVCVDERTKFTVAKPGTGLVACLRDAVRVQHDSIAGLKRQLRRWIRWVRE